MLRRRRHPELIAGTRPAGTTWSGTWSEWGYRVREQTGQPPVLEQAGVAVSYCTPAAAALPDDPAVSSTPSIALVACALTGRISRQTQAWFDGLWRLGCGPGRQEAVEIRRELADAYPDRYRPDLATSLRVLADVLDSLGSTTGAEAARHDANLG